MLVLLPPSETKRDGGDGLPLDLGSLSFPELTEPRSRAVSALVELSTDSERSFTALGLGPQQGIEVERNRALTSSATMPAIDRYTGVLYDGLAAGELSDAARAFAREHVAIHSALFGLLSADDRIPAYRLSHNSRLPKTPLRGLWRGPISEILALRRGLVIDLRSEAYAALGPVSSDGLYVRVVSEGADGRRKALSHFNKKAKGEFVRAIVEAGVEHPTAESLLEWAHGSGHRLERGREGELELVAV